MSALSLESTLPYGDVNQDELGRSEPPGRRRMRWQPGKWAYLLLVVTLVLLMAGMHDALRVAFPPLSATHDTAPAESSAVMPSAPTDGLLTLVIPQGAAADQLTGGRGYEMPPVISLRVGDTIVIRNEDDAPHMILYAWVEPGETNTRTFTQPGSEVYSSGCGLHASSFLNFTTIFVSE